LLPALLALGYSGMAWAGSSVTDISTKAVGHPTGGSVPSAEQRFFDKAAPAEPMTVGTQQKKALGPVVSGVLPAREARAEKKSVPSTAALSVPRAASPALSPVSGQASPEDLRNNRKPADSSVLFSLLVPPGTAPAAGPEKVAVGKVTGPASPEELRSYVKPAVVSAPDAPEAARAPTSGPVPPEEQRHFQK
jgi:hypothetical protein